MNCRGPGATRRGTATHASVASQPSRRRAQGRRRLSRPVNVSRIILEGQRTIRGERRFAFARAVVAEPKSAMTKRLLFLLVFIVAMGWAVLVAPAQQNDGQRYALLIGNSNYPDAPSPLAQPPKNVRALADELRRGGFEVDVKENLGREEMQRALDDFKAKIRPGSTALFFFSGYGLQANRQTFIIPINAQVWAENDVRRDGINIETVLNDLSARGARVKVLILDASRRNPYERRFRGAPAGLSTIDAPSGTLMVSAAAPGKATEEDGNNSVFIGEMVKEMRTPGLTVEEIFSRTRIGVSRVTNGDQVPWMSSSLTDDFYLTQPSGRIGTGPSDSRPQRQPPA